MLNPTRMQQIADSVILGREPDWEEDEETKKFVAGLKRDIAKAKAEGLVIDTPKEFEI